jgi:hypothetical protein
MNQLLATKTAILSVFVSYFILFQRLTHTQNRQWLSLLLRKQRCLFYIKLLPILKITYAQKLMEKGCIGNDIFVNLVNIN